MNVIAKIVAIQKVLKAIQGVYESPEQRIDTLEARIGTLEKVILATARSNSGKAAQHVGSG